MNDAEAKLILQAYRPGGQDANDPKFRAALEQAQRDPELARWFANEQALDSLISAKVKSAIATPAHLKSQLLAQTKIIRPVAWWTAPPSRTRLRNRRSSSRSATSPPPVRVSAARPASWPVK